MPSSTTTNRRRDVFTKPVETATPTTANGHVVRPTGLDTRLLACSLECVARAALYSDTCTPT